MASPNIAGLSKEVKDALLAAIAEARKEGIPITVTSAKRTAQQQAALYAKRASNRFPVAPPGSSRHETGDAVDIDTAPMTRGALNAIMERHGFKWAGRRDLVHYSYKGAPESPFLVAARGGAATGSSVAAPAESPFLVAARAAAASTTPSSSPTPSAKESPFLVAARAAASPAARDVPLGSQILAALMRPGNVAAAGANEFFDQLRKGGGPGEGAFRNAFRAMQETATAPLSAPAVPPAMLTNLFGQQPGDVGYNVTKPADYLLNFIYNPGDILAGKGLAKGVGLAAKGTAAGARGVQSIPAVQKAEAAVVSGVGRAFSRLAQVRGLPDAELLRQKVARGLSNVGQAPGATISRELEKTTNRRIANHGEVWGKIVVDMQRRTEQLRPILGDAGRRLSDPYNLTPVFKRAKEGGRQAAAKEAALESQRRAVAKEIRERNVTGETATKLWNRVKNRLAAIPRTAPETELGTAVRERQLLSAYRATGPGESPLQSAVIDYVEEVVKAHPEKPLTYHDLARETAEAIEELKVRADQHLAAVGRYRDGITRLKTARANLAGELQGQADAAEKLRLSSRIKRIDAAISARERVVTLSPGEWAAERAKLKAQLSAAERGRDQAAIRAARTALSRHRRLDQVRPETGAAINRDLTDFPADLTNYLARGDEKVHGDLHRYLALGIAGRYNVPVDDVIRFGRRALDHFEETVAMKRAVQGRLFGGANPERQRQKVVAAYLREGFTRAQADRIGSATSAAYSGGGIRLVREASLDTLEREILTSGVAKPVIQGEVLPGYVQIPKSSVFGTELHFSQVPVAVYNMIRRQATMAGRPRLMQKLKSPRYLVAEDEVTEELAQQGLFQDFWRGTAVPGMKRLLLNTFGTQFRNLFGNHLFAYLGAFTNGHNAVELMAAMRRALPQVVAYRKDRTVSPLMQQMRQFTDAFSNTTAGTASKGGYGEARDLAGMSGVVLGGRVVKPGQIASDLFNLPLHTFDLVEKTYKLALFDVLEKSMGAQAAAKEVDRWLFNYADQHPFLAALDRLGFWVFNYFPTEQAKRFVELLATRPDVLLTYPRLRALLFEEFPGSRDAYEQLRPDQKSLGTLPIGEREFLNLKPFIPLVSGMDTMNEIARSIQEKRMPDLGLSPRAFLSRTIISPEIAFATNQRLNLPADESRQVVPEGTAPEIESAILWREWMSNRLPGIARVLRRTTAAMRGVATTPGMTTEPQTVGQALLASFLGITTLRGERFDQAMARVENQLGVRAPVAGAAIGAAFEHYRAHPEAVPHSSVNREWTTRDLNGRLQAAQERMNALFTDPSVVSSSGELVDPGKIRAQVGYVLALATRYASRLAQEEQGGR